MLENFKPRIYQEAIFHNCVSYNTLVVLPTGLGKTAVAAMLAAHRRKSYPQSKILFLAPTKPLIQQHLRTFSAFMKDVKMVLFTGEIKPAKRAVLWKEAQIVFSTPQSIENDLIAQRVSLENVSLVIFDEAHRATGDYAYGFIAKQYNEYSKYPRILALTASPGSNAEKINEVCDNLYIEQIEVRTDEDPDVKPYIQQVDIEWIEVEFPDQLKRLHTLFLDCKKSRLEEIAKLGLVKRYVLEKMSKKQLLGFQSALHGEIARGNKTIEVLRTISLLAEVMKVDHALHLVETQGLVALHKYLSRMWKESLTTKTKALKNLVQNELFKTAFALATQLQGVEQHPKTPTAVSLIERTLKNKTNAKIILFSQFRDTAVALQSALTEKGVSSDLFVGQAKKGNTGLSQKEQKEMIARFSRGEFNVLISTSVGEEGLDIPQVDVVIFYEPVASAVRHIQRRGRTGRLEQGSVYVLVTKNTRDIGYRWSAHHKERRMYKVLKELKKKAFSQTENKNRFLSVLNMPKSQQTIQESVKQKTVSPSIKIFADTREKGGGVLKQLVEKKVKVRLQQLRVGDYILSERVGVEFKTVPDFIDSLVDGRLLKQLNALKENFERPVIIIEGEEDIYAQRKVHHHAIQGMLATIVADYAIPLIRTKNSIETAGILIAIAKREQKKGVSVVSMHGDKKPLTLKEQQEYVIASLPGIGPQLAPNLLARFRNVLQVMQADEEELKKVELIGTKKATRLVEFLRAAYKQE